MRSVMFRNALRIRPVRGLAGDTPGPGGPGGTGVRLTGPVSLAEPVGFGEPVSAEGPVALGGPVRPEGPAPPPGGDVPPAAPAGEEHTVTHSRRGEEDAVRDVSGRLRRAYASVDGATVEHAVAEAREAFRQARVRTFVPILVERRARAALDTAARRPRPAPQEGNPLSAP